MKLLVVSNNFLSFDNNNGKVMKNYLNAFSNNEIANFYISNDIADSSIASFNVTNKQALKSFLSFGIVKDSKNKKTLSEQRNSSIKYSPLKHLIRYLIWKSGFWKSKSYKAFIKKEKPERIVTFLGNNPYLLELSMKLSKKMNIPLVLFIGEDYPLKKFNYIEGKEKMGFFFKIFHRIEKKNFKKVINKCKLVIFNSDYIKDAYIKKYNIINWKVVYHLSSQKPLSKNNDSKTILYAGNLGLGRLDALIEISNVLQEIDSTLILKIFGNASEIDIQKLNKLENIHYNSFISNTELQEEYKNARLFLHVEKSNDFNNIDLRFAFSTKIADMICSHKPFLVYAPEKLACVKHLLKYSSDFVCSKPENLKEKLINLLSDKYIFNEDLYGFHDIKNGDLVKKYIENV